MELFGESYRKKRTRFSIVAIVCLILFLIFNPPGKKFRCDRFKGIIDSEIEGKVVKIYIYENQTKARLIDVEIRGLGRVVQVKLNEDRSDFVNYVKIGDLLEKKVNSSQIRVLRNEIDTTFILDFGCD